MFPKGKIPILHNRNIGTDHCQNCTGNQYDTGRNMLLELTPEAIVS